MEKKSRKGLYVFLGLMALVLVAGVTYAFITITLQGTKENSITGGSLTVTMNDTASELGNGEGDIVIADAFPVTDTVGMSKSPYTFTLSNTSAKNASYTVYLDEDPIETGYERMLDSQVKVYLTDGADTVLTEPTTVNNLGDKVARTVNGNTVQSSTLTSGVLEAGKTKTFVLRLWIDQNADESVMGKQYATKVSVDAVQVPEYAVTVINNATADEGIGMETVSKAVFKTATATIDVQKGTGTPSISCEAGGSAVEGATMDTTTDAAKITVTIPNVTAHTTCTISYTS